MAAVSQPLYSLDREAFDAAVSSIASRALPGLTVGFRDVTSDTLVPLKKLPDALANPGPAGKLSRFLRVRCTYLRGSIPLQFYPAAWRFDSCSLGKLASMRTVSVQRICKPLPLSVLLGVQARAASAN